MNINKGKLAATLLLAGICFSVGFSYGRQGVSPQNIPADIAGMVKGDKTENKADLSIFWDVWSLIDENYLLKPTDQQKMVYGAISGMVNSLGDPYSTFLTPEENKQLTEDMQGVFGGIGAEVGYRDGTIMVIAPLKGSPAEKAGLLAGDKIAEIDGQDTTDMNVDQVVGIIRGQEGTKVKLVVVRADKPLNFEITRETIQDKTVRWEMKGDKVAYIDITQFKRNTAKELDAQIGDILAQDPKGLVVDLRNNPGGYLDVVVDVASRFIDEGQTIVVEDSGDSQKTYKATGNRRFSGLPMTVLVNEGSASASEILAGALKDNKLATLVGKKTFGKGLVQGITDLKDGSALKITVAKWLTPSGNSINKNGIAPDVEVDYTEEDFKAGRDPQLDKALELMKK
jgi:carboxyl-terminal processing protease